MNFRSGKPLNLVLKSPNYPDHDLEKTNNKNKEYTVTNMLKKQLFI